MKSMPDVDLPVKERQLQPGEASETCRAIDDLAGETSVWNRVHPSGGLSSDNA
jgi:hypothetical protein